MASPSATAPLATVSSGSRWRDRKRYLWLLGLVVPVIPFRAVALYEKFDSELFLWLGPAVVFGVFPFFDLLIGKDRSNPPDRVVKTLEGDHYYRWLTWAYLPIQYAALVYACHVWSSDALGWTAGFGLAVTVGIVAGVAINTAHELGHKRPELERWLSKVGLAQTFYGHFYVEHNRGHHVRVATPEDPASSRLGESFWEFLPRTVWGSLRSAIRIERQRLAQEGKPFFTPANELLSAWAMSVALFGALVAAFGVGVLPWLAVQAVVGFSLLEVVNYIEHYGLRRERRADGSYERCRPEHSWNANDVASNLFLYHLQRHSDHHAHPARRYQALRHFEEAPQLPAGYAGMIPVALVPPWWRRVMDRRVLAHYGGDVTRASIQPRLRERILARYGDANAAAS
jgi:alkane 1-monooxygenase